MATGNLAQVQTDNTVDSRKNFIEGTNSIFIGPKPFMNYVTAVVMQFTTKNAEEIVLKARGKFISRTVDVAEISCKRFLTGQIAVGNIKIGSEEFQNNEGKTVRVSTIDIQLVRI